MTEAGTEESWYTRMVQPGNTEGASSALRMAPVVYFGLPPYKPKLITFRPPPLDAAGTGAGAGGGGGGGGGGGQAGHDGHTGQARGAADAGAAGAGAAGAGAVAEGNGRCG
jgi:hypothetical protein